MITYSDLITLLLGLFIILYSISNVDSGKYNNVVKAIGSAFGNSKVMINPFTNNGSSRVEVSLKDDLSRVIKENNFENSVRLEENERGMIIHILGDILFTSGSANLNNSSLVMLDKLAAIIRKLPNDIRIEGHTDNVPMSNGNFPSNWHLSVNRALNTAYYLINQQNMPAGRVAIVGYSEYKPIADNNTFDGRKLNRRVDIVIIKK
jgi:chemotaxis protein MotB